MTQGCPQGLAQRTCGLVNTVWRGDSGRYMGAWGLVLRPLLPASSSGNGKGLEHL